MMKPEEKNENKSKQDELETQNDPFRNGPAYREHLSKLLGVPVTLADPQKQDNSTQVIFLKKKRNQIDDKESPEKKTE